MSIYIYIYIYMFFPGSYFFRQCKSKIKEHMCTHVKPDRWLAWGEAPFSLLYIGNPKGTRPNFGPLRGHVPKEGTGEPGCFLGQPTSKFPMKCEFQLPQKHTGALRGLHLERSVSSAQGVWYLVSSIGRSFFTIPKRPKTEIPGEALAQSA